MAYRFPGSDLDKPAKMMNLLGSFWDSVYGKRADINAMTGDVSELHDDNVAYLQKVAKLLNRHEAPIHDTPSFVGWTIRQSDKQDYTLRYDQGANFGQNQYEFDVQTVLNAHAWEMPDLLDNVDVITSRIEDPDVTWLRTSDFIVDKDQRLIVFRFDPFTDARLVASPSIRDGDTELEITLWMVRPQQDKSWLQTQWGSTLGQAFPSTEMARDVINAVLDSLQDGASYGNVAKLLSALTGIPLAKHAGEVVQQIGIDRKDPEQPMRVVVTDQEVYMLRESAELLVDVGDTLQVGDSITDGLQLHQPTNGAVPSWLSSLSLGRGYLVGDFLDDITFHNQDVELDVTKDSNGKTRVSWALGGNPLDVEAFWDSVHTRGLAAKETIANLLDIRPDPDNQPEADNLPETINPLEFLISNLLRHNLLLVRIRADAVRHEAAMVARASQLIRAVIAPGTAILLVIELPTASDSGILGVIDDSLDTFTAAEPTQDGYGLNKVVETMSVKKVSGVCQ